MTGGKQQLNTTAATLFDCSAADVPCRGFFVRNLDGANDVLVTVSGLHDPAFPAVLSAGGVQTFTRGSLEVNGISKVTAAAAAGTPTVAFGVAERV